MVDLSLHCLPSASIPGCVYPTFPLHWSLCLCNCRLYLQFTELLQAENCPRAVGRVQRWQLRLKLVSAGVDLHLAIPLSIGSILQEERVSNILI